jgi:hypothetical protein
LAFGLESLKFRQDDHPPVKVFYNIAFLRLQPERGNGGPEKSAGRKGGNLAASKIPKKIPET